MAETQIDKPKKIDPVGIAYYGDSFVHFMKIGEVTDLIAAFKEYYYQARIKDKDARLSTILQGFNDEVCKPVGRLFHPYTNQIRIWRRKWDLDLMQQQQDTDLIIPEKRNIKQIIKTKDAERELALGAVGDNELEAGVRTLGGELLNDAFQMLKDDQELEEIYEDEVLIKRRNYILNVFGHVTKLVHGKAALMLKASEEKRNNASFLMTLLAQATAGKMSDEQLGMLKTTYSPAQPQNEQPSV